MIDVSALRVSVVDRRTSRFPSPKHFEPNFDGFCRTHRGKCSQYRTRDALTTTSLVKVLSQSAVGDVTESVGCHCIGLMNRDIRHFSFTVAHSHGIGGAPRREVARKVCIPVHNSHVHKHWGEVQILKLDVSFHACPEGSTCWIRIGGAASFMQTTVPGCKGTECVCVRVEKRYV